MRADAFDYDLPAELVAQEPARRRDDSRLMVLWGSGQEAEPPEHRRFHELPELLEAGDLLVLNDARVLPARLQARRATGGRVELLLLEPVESASLPDAEGAVWRALARPARRVRVGEPLRVGDDDGVELRVVATGEAGERHLEFPVGIDVEEFLGRHGAMPLPPYIEAPDTETRRQLDRRRYQTVYARAAGAVAAPTAGLHFTPKLLDEIRHRGIRTAPLTLHVGPGTFRPVSSDLIDDHVMDAERFVIPEQTADEVAAARERGARVVAVGTTCVRALEHAAARADGSLPAPGADSANLFIVPGYRFRVVDGMLTNFHLPRSTPMLLVSALVGRERLLAAYRAAVDAGYRFYSYGDAMLLLP